MVGIPPGTRKPHLQKFSRHVHSNEIIFQFVDLKFPEYFRADYGNKEKKDELLEGL